MALCEIKFKFPDWRRKIQAHWDDIHLFIAAQMQYNRAMLFDKEGAYNGHDGWAPLKFRVGQILSKRGTLRKSIAPRMTEPALGAKAQPGPNGIVRVAGNEVTIGTSLIYAWMMNSGTKDLPGGVLRPVRAKALKIPLPGGKQATEAAKELRKTGKTLPKKVGKGTERVIFRKWVKIPARPFDDWTSEDEDELRTALRNKLAKVLNT
jgi:phage gpG-like protein